MSFIAIGSFFDSAAELEMWIYSVGGRCDLGRAKVRVGWKGPCRTIVVTESKDILLDFMVDDPGTRPDRPLDAQTILHTKYLQSSSVSASASSL